MKMKERVSRKALTITAVAALFLGTAIPRVAAAAEQCNVNVFKWTKANNLTSVEAPQDPGRGYPETNSATYWGIVLRTHAGDGLKLTLTADFPDARYMAYTLYSVDDNDDKGDPIRYKGNPQHLTDQNIIPLESSGNPFVDYSDRDITPRHYEIYVVQESRLNGEPGPNTLVIPSNVSQVALFLRVYLPDNPNDPKGGVDLPKIFAEPECPDEKDVLTIPEVVDKEDIINTNRLDSDGILLKGRLDDIESFKPGDYGLFPNGDCPYLTVPLVPFSLKHPKIAVLRFKAPTFPDTRNVKGEKFDPSKTEVRYWSVCMGDWAETTASKCIADQDAVRDKNGYVHIVIGPDDLIEEKPNWINLPWAGNQRPMLLFRQISPQKKFDGNFNKAEEAFNDTVENVRLDVITPDKYASTAIKEYAPIGIYCSVNDFNTNECGFNADNSEPDDSSDTSDSSDGATGCGN